MQIIKFKPTYIKENGTMVIYGKSIPFPDNFTPLNNESGVILLLPDSFGGNHSHPRIECFYSLGELTITWIENGKTKNMLMSPENGEFKLFITLPNEDHVIANNTDKDQILVEFASEPQHGVKPVDIL